MRMLLTMWSEGVYEGDTEEDYAAWTRFENAVQEAGVFVESGQFVPGTASVVVTELDGGSGARPGPLTADGRSAAGFYLLECASLDEAESWARRAPLHGVVEVRPLVEF